MKTPSDPSRYQREQLDNLASLGALLGIHDAATLLDIESEIPAPLPTIPTMTDHGETAIAWIRARYQNPDAEFYPNPVGPGWCCDLGIREAGVRRSATCATKAEAAQAAAVSVASAPGWQHPSPR